jgi:hypothetical protein
MPRADNPWVFLLLSQKWGYVKMAFRGVLFLILIVPGLAQAETLTLPTDQRPDWLRRDGIVMAGSWEPLPFRVRRDGSDGYIPTPEQRAAYEREHSPEMVARLKALGVNFVMAHSYKAFGLDAERESMADAVRFAKLCHDAGLRVGVYNNSGTLGWELLFKERPQAKDWVVLDRDSKPMTYGRATYRYWWDRNHPDAQAFHRNLVRFAVNEIHADLLHFDNYSVGPGSEPNSVQRFRRYLRDTFSDEQRKQMGITNLDAVGAVLSGTRSDPLRRAWLDFSCQSLADSYYGMSRYARSLRKDVLVECNPGGVRESISPPIDHGRLLEGGEAFWDESRSIGYQDGKLRTRIPTYKMARRMNNIAFTYCTTPLEMAEAMAFNLDCLGCICWFEYGKITPTPDAKTAALADYASFVRFFHKRRDLLRDASVVADVAVLRSFPSQVLADPKHAQLTARVEQTLIEKRFPFQIIFDHHLDDLKRYRVLVLAGCVALSDRQIDKIKQYVKSGGRLCIIGPAATNDEWMNPRQKPALSDVESENVVQVSEKGDCAEAIARACDNRLSLAVAAPAGLCAELTEQSGRRLVHLVNYRADGPVENVEVAVRAPAGRSVRSVTLAGPQRETDADMAFREQAGVVTFTVPSVGVYEIAEIALK